MGAATIIESDISKLILVKCKNCNQYYPEKEKCKSLKCTVLKKK